MKKDTIQYLFSAVRLISRSTLCIDVAHNVSHSVCWCLLPPFGCAVVTDIHGEEIQADRSASW